VIRVMAGPCPGHDGFKDAAFNFCIALFANKFLTIKGRRADLDAAII
jgi:hypothetical protein